MTSKPEVFRLEPFHFGAFDTSGLASLPIITPRFSLPSLEDGNASDRLLAGLRSGRPSRAVKVDNTKGKGKEKELDTGEHHEHERPPVDEGHFWLNVVDSEPGPSKPRLSKVRSSDATTGETLMPSPKCGMICVILSLQKTRHSYQKRQSLPLMP